MDLIFKLLILNTIVNTYIGRHKFTIDFTKNRLILLEFFNFFFFLLINM